MRCLLLLALLGTTLTVVSANNWIVCYFSSWAVYRPGNGRFDVDDVDPDLCTHAIFGFAGLSNHTWTIEVLDPWNENCPEDDPPGNHCAYDRFVALKQKNPALKVILAVGGWNEGSEDYSNMVADPEKRATFIKSCVALVNKHNFDGLDVDWEYPTQRGGVPADREGFILLLDEFRVEFDKQGLILTAALASGKPTIDPSYDVAGLFRNLDVLSIMTYDYHGAWENTTHINAPLCGYPSDEGNMTYFNVVFSINYWLELGAPPEKTVMGVALYGRCFTLDDIEDHGMLASATEPGVPGPYTRLPGTQGWNEICIRIQDTSDCTVVHDPFLHEPYMYCLRDNLWCGYDDEASVYEKGRFAKNIGLAGTMVWTIDTDDFVPTCSDRKFNLINTLKDAFKEDADGELPDCSFSSTTADATNTPELTETTPDQSYTTPKPTADTTANTHELTETTPDQSNTTPEPTADTHEPTTITPPIFTTDGNPITTPATYPNKPDCSLDPDREFYPDEDCNMYWWCVDGDAILMLCSPGTYFDPELLMCNFQQQVDTSHCKEWICEADGDVFAGANCNEYYECEHGRPTQKFCADGLYFNPDTEHCDHPGNVDTTTCNPVM